MIKRRDAIGALLLVLLIALTAAAEARDWRQRKAFTREHPCPVTGKRSGACPGWQVDHIVALCAGGPDEPSNMQWLRVEDHRIKTRGDRATCRRLLKPMNSIETKRGSQ